MATKKVVTGDVIWAEKNADAEVTYRFDLTDLLPDHVTALTSVTWTPPTGGPTVTFSTIEGLTAVVRIAGGTEKTWYVFRAQWVAGSDTDEFFFRLFIKEDQGAATQLGSALFPNRFTAVEKLRRDRLFLLGQSINVDTTVSDDYLWDKLVAAEAQVARVLRVPLQVTQFFPTDPTPEQLAALPAGMPWKIDPGYDYDPSFFRSERWGFIMLRNRPVDSLQDVKIVFPVAGSPTSFYQIPADWPVLDRKYGEVQFVPISGTGGIALNAFMLQNLSFGRDVPFSIRVAYRAGLNAADWPDLVDATLKKAVLKVVEDMWLPQSGSISADGLSQSMSLDMEKYRDTVDAVLNGAKGTNGGLMAAIHGVRGLVM